MTGWSGRGPYADNAFRYYSTGLKYQLADEWTLSTNYSYSSTRTRRNEVGAVPARPGGRL